MCIKSFHFPLSRVKHKECGNFITSSWHKNEKKCEKQQTAVRLFHNRSHMFFDFYMNMSTMTPFLLDHLCHYRIHFLGLFLRFWALYRLKASNPNKILVKIDEPISRTQSRHYYLADRVSIFFMYTDPNRCTFAIYYFIDLIYTHLFFIFPLV